MVTNDDAIANWRNVSRSPDGRIYWAVAKRRRLPSLVRQPLFLVLAADEATARRALERHKPSLAQDSVVLRPANVIEVQLATHGAPLSRRLELVDA